MYRSSIILLAMFALAIAAIHAGPGDAIPAFARKYGLACSACHIAIPKLKDYGNDFAGNGFQLPDKDEPVRAFRDTGDEHLLLQRELPLAIRFDAFARFRSKGDINSDLQTPYGLKLLSGGNVAPDIGYYFYFYMNERGEVAGLEDAYIHFNNLFGTKLDIMVGQFQVSDPLFKRELRLTYEDYQIYKTTVGDSRTDLTYERGVMATYSFPTKTELILEIVNGSGIGETGAMFDNDNNKNVFAKIKQEIPFGDIGFFVYTGREDELGSDNPATFNNECNDFLFLGPDISVGTGRIELNAQYIRRTDNNPMFAPGFDDDQVTEGYIGEAIFNPFPKKSRLFGILLYNKVTSDLPGYEYETATAGISYLLHTNMRIMGELTRDMENKETLFTLGTVMGF
jgi:hypothetical protein